MTKFQVLVTDHMTVVRSARVEIEADSEDAALERVDKMYRDGDLELVEEDVPTEATDASYEVEQEWTEEEGDR